MEYKYSRPEPIDLNGIRETRKGACRNCRKVGHYIRECRSRPREQRPNQRSQLKKIFKRTL